MLADKFKLTVISLVFFAGILLAIIACELNNISKQNSNRYVINSDGSVVLDTRTGNVYIIDNGTFDKVEMK